jgi:hypothetical protein
MGGEVMELDQILAAKNRAEKVVDGLAKVKDQQARDVLKLAEHIDQQNKTINTQDMKIAELRKLIIEIKGKQQDSKDDDISKIFGDIFGGRRFK